MPGLSPLLERHRLPKAVHQQAWLKVGLLEQLKPQRPAVVLVAVQPDNCLEERVEPRPVRAVVVQVVLFQPRKRELEPVGPSRQPPELLEHRKGDVVHPPPKCYSEKQELLLLGPVNQIED